MQKLPYWRLSSYYFFYFAFLGAFAPYFALYLQSLSFSPWDIGILMSQMQLMRLFGPYFWGVLADRIGKRLAIIRATGVATFLLFSAFFFISRFETILAVLIVFSFFWVAAMPLTETLTFEHLRDKPSGYGRIRIWGSASFILAVLLVGWLLDRFGIRSLIPSIMLMLGLSLIHAFLLPEATRSESQKKTETATVSIAEILRQPHVRALLIACFCMTAAHGTLNIFYSIFLSDHGYNKSAVGFLWSVGVLAEIIVFFYMSPLLARFSVRSILIASFAAAIVRFALIGLAVDYPIILFFAQLLHGLTFGTYHAASMAAINRWFPGPTRSRGQALYSSAGFGAGGLVGGLVSGWCWETLGGNVSFILSSLYPLAGVLLILRWMRENRNCTEGGQTHAKM